MSERAIERGDLVMIVKPSPCVCGTHGGMGKIFVVDRVSVTPWRCPQCRREHADELCAWFNGVVAATHRLKKIPPLTAPERVLTADEVTA